jgi:protocatechuate 3,4-dioxygenase alpha subunit
LPTCLLAFAKRFGEARPAGRLPWQKRMSKNKHTQTPSQTVGPFFAYGLTAEDEGYNYTQIANGNLITVENIEGEKIIITGRVLDGAGSLISDALVEIWQSDANGSYGNQLFSGFGRSGTGHSEDGSFRFETIKPGSVSGAAPHINVVVFLRGLLLHVFTRIYFSDEIDFNNKDEVLNMVPPDRRHTLIAQRNDKQGGAVYYFDIHIQGEKETIFFDI